MQDNLEATDDVATQICPLCFCYRYVYQRVNTETHSAFQVVTYHGVHRTIH